MPSTFNREDLFKLPGMTPRLARALETQAQTTNDNSTAVQANVAATKGLNEATVLVLSQNDSFDNERVVAFGQGFTITDGGPGGQLTIRLSSYIKVNGGYRVTLNALADTNLTMPTSGTIATTIFPGPYADDATAASNGVGVGETYQKPAGLLAWRVS